jgi:SAM-dependent methyltransferase
VKPLDRYLRRARIARGRPFARPGDTVIDVGCGDGALFEAWHDVIGHGVGVDPALAQRVDGPNYELHPGPFPAAVPAGIQADLITMFAVLEHMPSGQQATLAEACRRLLRPGGRIVATVPSPAVDIILHVLARLHLIDGMSIHEHHGYRPQDTPALFPAPAFRLVLWRRFQFGLNNLFVFERTED